MPIRSYPRPHQRLAPRLLGEFLRIPVEVQLLTGDKQRVLLSDLDETIWSRCDEATCAELSLRVVRRIRQAKAQLLGAKGDLKLPAVPTGAFLDDLPLETRTRNALAREGFEEDMRGLESLTVSQLLHMPGFGARCLVDLLTSIESFDSVLVEHPWAFQSLSADFLRQEVKNLLHDRWEGGTLLNLRSDDPRLRHLIAPLCALSSAETTPVTPREAILTLDLSQGDVRSVHALELLQQLKASVERMAGLTLEEELKELVPRVTSERNRELFYLRMGWDGKGVRTLQEVADSFGMTRERARQICQMLTNDFADKRPYAPVLDKALALLNANVPASRERMEAMLRSSGLTQQSFSLESLLLAAEMLGRPVRLALLPLAGDEFVLDADKTELPPLVLQVARNSVARWGVTNVEHVLGQAAQASGKRVPREFVIRMLEEMADFRWVDRGAGWFWLSSVSPNRLLNQIRKILSVAKRIDVTDLRTGISRHQRMEGFAPPAHVLLQLCRQLPDYTTTSELVSLRNELDWRTTLGTEEQTLVRVLLRHARPMSRTELEDECRQEGMKESTFQTYVDYAPFVRKYPHGLYGLRGYDFYRDDPSPVSESSPQKRKPVLVDHGVLANEVWVRYKLSRPTIKSGIITVPASLGLEREEGYRIESSLGPSGTLLVKANHAWGLTPFFRRFGCAEGDEVRITFNPSRGSALIEVQRAKDGKGEG